MLLIASSLSHNQNVHVIAVLPVLAQVVNVLTTAAILVGGRSLVEMFSFVT